MSSDQTFRAALVQLRSGREVEPNIEAAKELIAAAALDGAHYVQTPENTSLMELKTDRLFARLKPEAETGFLQEFSELARDLGIWLHIGSAAVLTGDGRAANRAFIFKPDGAIAARYDKIHMFDVDLPNGERYCESKNYRPGEQAVTVDLPWCRLGLSICYDLRFPEQYKALALQGADVLTVPAAFTKATGRAHWQILLRARAIETGSFVLAAAQGGTHENGRATYGHSLIISPWGEVLAEAGEEPCFVCADIDPNVSRETRQQIPALRHARDIACSQIND
ncbi:MAG: carbon-nitrogen hydrolase family protein [Hyphomicrobiales bacterium]|nr:carbon-nitrogen hydrolase family protein [Hyphomicrobiales bacterium]